MPSRRRRLPIPLILALFWALLAPISPDAATSQLRVTVTDQNDAPLSDAVVFITRKDGGPIAGAPLETPGVVDQESETFKPLVSAIPVGSSVIFANSDPISHHVFSFSKPKRLNVLISPRKQSKPAVFDKPGPVPLGCNIHDHMLAYIYVTPTPFFAVSRAAGSVDISGLSPGEYQLNTWHPRAPRLATTSQPLTIGAGQTEITVSLKVRPKRRLAGKRSLERRRYR